MSRALKGAPGISKIDITAGDQDFTVQFDSATTNAAAIVEALKKGGEPGAKLKS